MNDTNLESTAHEGPEPETDTTIPEPAANPAASGTALIGASVGAVVAGLIGAAAWAVMVVVTNYEIGFAAIGIGMLSGFAVLLASGGARGVLFQIVAVLGALIGVLLGKYLTFMVIVSDMMAEEAGLVAPGLMDIPWLSGVSIFFANLSEVLGGYDLLWIAFAVIAAWKMPAAE